MNNDKSVSLYLVVPSSDKDRLKSLKNRLVINYIVRQLTKKMEFEDARSEHTGETI